MQQDEKDRPAAEDRPAADKDELVAEYANNTYLEPSIWDMKIFFGQCYQSSGGSVDWHAAITLPWLQAKLLAHYLRVNVALDETLNGKIKVPVDLRPNLPSDPVEGQSPVAREAIKRIHQEFFSELDETSTL